MPLLIKTTGLEEYLDQSGGAYVKCLIMGESGVGKTPFAAQFPKPIFADCEKGLMSIAELKIPYASIENSSDMAALLDHLRLDSQKPPLSRKYQTLVIDAIDTYQRKLIQERLKSERKDAFSGHGDWGWLSAKMTQLVEQLLALKINVVVNMHVKDVEDGEEDSRIQVKRSALKGEIKDSIWQDFDLIGLLEKSFAMEGGERVVKRHIRWHSEPRFPTLRDRSNRLPRFTDVTFTTADYDQIYEAITGGLESLPATEELESLEVDGDAVAGDVGNPEQPGGPLSDVKLPAPAAKRAAKKAPAKKAAAKPAATPEPVAEAAPVEAAAEPVAEPVTETPTEPATPVEEEKSAGEQALIDELGAEEVAVEPAPAADPTPAATAAPAARLCGDQPASRVGKIPAKEGCRKDLSEFPPEKLSLSMIKTGTWLCPDCYAKNI